MTLEQWPPLPLGDWLPTCATLHRWTQIVGKTRLELSPFENHWWHCALYVSVRGLTTSPMPVGRENLEVEFDFLDDLLVARMSDGRTRSVRLESKSVADLYDEYLAMLADLGIELRIHERPNELLDATPFSVDREHATYDADAARRCWRILSGVDRVFKAFRGEFTGKSSPSHFWWGGFDIACTRFSGRLAPTHPGGIPNCPNYVAREAYSRECISAGWWPGSADGPVDEPAFYAYGYPEPAGYPVAAIEPSDAIYNSDMKEWILPYDRVRREPNADAIITQFLASTYLAAAKLGGWDIDGLRSQREIFIDR